jgi:magnesium transporter
VIGYGGALLWGNGHVIAIIVAFTLLAVVITGMLVGAMLPLLLTKLGFDPALASSPFVASFVDVAGILIYFSFATWMLAGT